MYPTNGGAPLGTFTTHENSAGGTYETEDYIRVPFLNACDYKTCECPVLKLNQNFW